MHEHLLPSLHATHVTVDARHLTFTEPLGLVAMASFAEAASRAGRRVVMLRPDDEAVGRYLTRICEAGQNVAHHSGNDRGFFAAQATHGGSQLLFAVGDSGRGMRATLEARGATSDADALRLGLTPKVTGTGDPGRGRGLPDVAAQLVGTGGQLHVLPGNATLTVTSRARSRTAASFGYTGTLLQGTVLVAPGRTHVC
jgi:hypothetical protein